jgi:hypothetical protein
MIISIPIQTLIAQQLKTMQEKQMKNRDKRTRLMSELLANIKRYAYVALLHLFLIYWLCSIKLYAWEFAFIRRVLFVRNEQEVKMLRTIGVVTVWSFCCLFLKVVHLPTGTQHHIMEWYPSFGCLQLVCNGSCNEFETSDFRCYIPRNLVVHASTVSSGDGIVHFRFQFEVILILTTVRPSHIQYNRIYRICSTLVRIFKS